MNLILYNSLPIHSDLPNRINFLYCRYYLKTFMDVDLSFIIIFDNIFFYYYKKIYFFENDLRDFFEVEF